MGRIRGRRHSCRGERHLIDGVDRLAGEVLYRTACQPGGDRAPHRLGHSVGIIGEAVLEIGRYRDVDRIDDQTGVRERLLPSHQAVPPAERRREPAARGRQRLEAGGLQHPGRSPIPGVGHQQWRRTPM